MQARSQLQLVRSLRKDEATRTYIWGLAKLRPDMAGRRHGGGVSVKSLKRTEYARLFEEKDDKGVESKGL